MDEYSNAKVAGQAAKPARASDMAMAEIDRLNSRLNSTLGELAEMRDRVRGTRPDQASKDECETAFVMGGFVGGIGQSIERAHRLLTDINEIVGEIAGVV